MKILDDVHNRAKADLAVAEKSFFTRCGKEPDQSDVNKDPDLNEIYKKVLHSKSLIKFCVFLLIWNLLR